MKKTYIEANFRIDDVVFNTGYICIDKDSITGIFTFDRVIIEINKEIMSFLLFKYDSESNSFLSPESYNYKYNLKSLESPHTYTLKSDSNETLKFELIKKVTNPNIISRLDDQFKVASNN